MAVDMAPTLVASCSFLLGIAELVQEQHYQATLQTLTQLTTSSNKIVLHSNSTSTSQTMPGAKKMPAQFST